MPRRAAPPRPRFRHEDIRLSARLSLPPGEAYGLLVSRESLARWWGGKVEAEGKNGGVMRAPGPRKALKGVFVDLEPGRKAAWLWDKASLPAGAPLLTSVFLEEEGGGCRVTLVHAGFPASGRSTLEAFHKFWRERIERLAELSPSLRASPWGRLAT